MLGDLEDAEAARHERDVAAEESDVHEEQLFFAGDMERAAVEGCFGQAACGPLHSPQS